MRFHRTLCSALLVLASAGPMYASTLASAGLGGIYNINPNYLGEAFSVSGTGNYSSITFNFYTTGGSPFATGTGFLLSQAYTGAPIGLNSATAGYLGSVAASGNLYSFGSGVQLSANSTYYFYENMLVPTGTIGGAYTATSLPETYYAASGGNFTAQPGATDAFLVTGSPVMATSVTPEPSSFALLGTGVLGVLGVLRRRLQA